MDGPDPLRDGHFLDEIIDQTILKNGRCGWNNLGRVLKVKPQLIKRTVLRFNECKITASTTPPEKLKTYEGRSWTRYKTFITNGGDPLPVQPELLFKALFPETDIAKTEQKITRAYTGNCRIPVCPVAAAEAPPPDAPGEQEGRPGQSGAPLQEAGDRPQLPAAGGKLSHSLGSARKPSAKSGLPFHLAASPLTVIHHCTARRRSLHTARSIASKLMHQIAVLLFASRPRGFPP